MDIEKLKKVNQLATTLRNQGLASGRDDAAKLAGEMSWEQEDNVDHIFKENNQAEEIKSEGRASSASEERKDEKEKAVPDEHRMIEILQKFADQFNAEINRLNEKINEQEETIKQISQKLVNMRVGEQGSSSESVTESSNPQQQLNTEKQKGKQEEQPRSGDYNSEDVSIEDFFYYGQR